MKVNLLYKKPDGTVLFLEAKKDFVDLLMSFLVLPVGSVIKLLRTVDSGMETGATRLFESIEKMDQSSMEVSKSVLTNPAPDTFAFHGGKMLTIENSQSTTSPVYYKCGYSSCYNARADNASFSCHQNYGYQPVQLTMLPNEENSTKTAGYVKENVIFMITDELEVYPTSTIKSIVLLNKLKVKAMADLESIEALSLLKASLVSKTVLNDVFKSYVSQRSF
ncbi:hypothetical protein SELMODRAFT_426812 [Selaginella moellendorffii]|uniref:DUF674 domain-containing protein n=1 Tax=Selaginella moellendorffii TaxID=88036 RepID=D8SXK3_SELML|nr:hypothetical protein SELMODRAFT_426812 [Selaginella moellendorffii]